MSDEPQLRCLTCRKAEHQSSSGSIAAAVMVAAKEDYGRSAYALTPDFGLVRPWGGSWNSGVGLRALGVRHSLEESAIGLAAYGSNIWGTSLHKWVAGKSPRQTCKSCCPQHFSSPCGGSVVATGIRILGAILSFYSTVIPALLVCKTQCKYY